MSKYLKELEKSSVCMPERFLEKKCRNCRHWDIPYVKRNDFKGCSNLDGSVLEAIKHRERETNTTFFITSGEFGCNCFEEKSCF